MGKNAPEPNWLERAIPNSENARSSTQQFGNTEVSLLIPLNTTHLQPVVFCTQSISGAYFRMLKCFTLVKLPRLPFLSISTQFRLYSVKSIILHRVHAWHRKKSFLFFFERHPQLLCDLIYLIFLFCFLNFIQLLKL